MFNRSYSQSGLKQAHKTTLDTTRYTSRSNFYNNSQTFNQQFQVAPPNLNYCLSECQNQSQKHSKYDEAFRKARGVVDQLIGLVQDKRQATKQGIKNVGDTNQYLLDLWSEGQLFNSYPNPPQIISYPMPRQSGQGVDLQKLQLLKVIQAQKSQNQNLQRKCYQLEYQNKQLRSSRASRPSNSYLPTPTLIPDRVQTRPQNFMIPPQNFAGSRLFAELQNLKQQNQVLRQKTIHLLQSNHY